MLVRVPAPSARSPAAPASVAPRRTLAGRRRGRGSRVKVLYRGVGGRRRARHGTCGATCPRAGARPGVRLRARCGVRLAVAARPRTCTYSTARSTVYVPCRLVCRRPCTSAARKSTRHRRLSPRPRPVCPGHTALNQTLNRQHFGAPMLAPRESATVVTRAPRLTYLPTPQPVQGSTSSCENSLDARRSRCSAVTPSHAPSV